jgi:hypothetical protein
LALSAAFDAADEVLLLMKGPLVKRIAIAWFVESLFGPPHKRPDWTLLMIFTGIAIVLLMLGLRFAP